MLTPQPSWMGTGSAPAASYLLSGTAPTRAHRPRIRTSCVLSLISSHEVTRIAIASVAMNCSTPWPTRRPARTSRSSPTSSTSSADGPFRDSNSGPWPETTDPTFRRSRSGTSRTRPSWQRPWTRRETRPTWRSQRPTPGTSRTPAAREATLH